MEANILFVDKVHGRDDHAHVGRSDKAFSSISHALKIGSKIKDSLIIKVSAGIYLEPELEIFDNLTLEGADVVATQVYTTVNSHKLKGTAAIKNLSLIGNNVPVLLSLGPGTLNLDKIRLVAFGLNISPVLGIIANGSVILSEFDIIFNSNRIGNPKIWNQFGGELQLRNGSQRLNLLPFTTVDTNCIIKDVGSYKLQGNLKLQLQLEEHKLITLMQTEGKSQVHDLSLSPNEVYVIANNKNKHKNEPYHAIKLTNLDPITPVIHAIDTNDMRLLAAGENFEIPEGYFYQITIMDVKANDNIKHSNSIISSSSNFLYFI